MKILFYESWKTVDVDKLKGKTAVVIDVLRATSTIVTALKNGAKFIVPVKEVEEAWQYYNNGDKKNIILGGERKAVQIQGFHFGNSPLSYTEERIKDKIVVLTTTNGTKAIDTGKDADNLYIGSFLNSAALIHKLAMEEKDLAIICSGTDGIFSLDDIVCGGKIIYELSKENRIESNDLGMAAKILYQNYKDDLHLLLKNCYHYNLLLNNGFGQDLQHCFNKDIYDVIPYFKGGEIRI